MSSLPASRRFRGCLALVAGVCASLGTGASPLPHPSGPLPPPLTIDQLARETFDGQLVAQRPLEPGPGYAARLVSYRSGGLLVHALVAVPEGPRPPAGFPVLVASHGTHPDPPRYGFTAAGEDSRPGDYYRAVPALFAAQGFLVVMPDFRGHNSSQGVGFAHGQLAPAYYAQDLLALLAALPALPEADCTSVFLWGHSLGGEVTLRALLSADGLRGITIRAASLWSSTGGDPWEQAFHYGRRARPEDEAGDDIPVAAVEALRHDLAALAAPYDWREGDPLRYLDRLAVPVILHHGLADQGARYAWSERLAARLLAAGKPFRFHGYATDQHFFVGELQRQAVARDVAFFRDHAGAVAAHVTLPAR